MDNNTYLHILKDTLIKKNILLDKLLIITTKQEEYLNKPNPDLEVFDQTFTDKDEYIQQINPLDDGFEKIYNHVKEELSTQRSGHKEEIEALQELIRQITDKSTKLQVNEMRNKNKIEACLLAKKKEIKNIKISRRTASNYYKNMHNKSMAESFFLDKKK
ncbi:MAG: flagellar export chaperone FlgN [Anaerocolumna sp.]